MCDEGGVYLGGGRESLLGSNESNKRDNEWAGRR